MTKIDRQHYPALNHIMWDLHQTHVEPELAFELYEKRWAHIDQALLDANEKKLIDALVAEFGNGVFMPAAY